MASSAPDQEIMQSPPAEHKGPHMEVDESWVGDSGEDGAKKEGAAAGAAAAAAATAPPPAPSPSPPRRPPLRAEDLGLPIQDGWWLAEVLSWVGSVIALGVIICTIALADGKALPDWPMHITLNSFVSFMSTLMKAALLIPVTEGISQLKWLWFKQAGAVKDIQTFDSASRGLWGSALLIFTTRGTHLAKLGAAITILALGLDPFIQQVITYPTRVVPSRQGNATITTTRSYSEYAPGAIMALRQPTLDMKAAIHNGLFNTKDRPQDDFGLQPSCVSGNCTWSHTYHSLAVCTKCANTTSHITIKTMSSVAGGYKVYTLPNGLQFEGSKRGSFFMNSTGLAHTINFHNKQSTISSVSTMRGVHDLSATNLLTVVSNECVLYFCVNEYQAVVTDGIFQENVVRSYTADRDPETGKNISITVPGQEKAYYVTAPAWTSLQQYLVKFWTGNVTGDVGELSATDDTLSALYSLGESGKWDGTQKVEGENNTIAAVAASMTKALRTRDKRANGTDLVLGITWTVETYVRIRWLWMSLPLALDGLVLVFLMATMWRSRSSGVATWKSSTFPLLILNDIAEHWGKGDAWPKHGQGVAGR